MCTVSWILDSDRYSLYCNRDELRTRPPALPPQRHDEGGARFLAPTDGQAGGTWIAVNAHGLSLCLLNDYASKPPNPEDDFTSRGLLVKDLVRATDMVMLVKRWPEHDLRQYRPFKLLALAPSQHALLFGWNGDVPSVKQDAVRPPLCSSSFDDLGAARSRADLLHTMAARTDLEPRKRQLQFHQSHRPARGPYSVCMHRPDAVTVSLTVVEVDPATVSMAYAQGSPCAAPLEHLATLDRVS